ncbi:hypothetical protein [Mesorhizobium sp. B263B2A]|uniref:hypothetical protein n=1 Tax=Mesorhizobium sp. B263B2A TaxID=2876669 RepID=UPI001CD047E2|nr:hypothetical protein [Mesorhizobium sp. B263B2A]MCA0032718.1 hypothetical protein [Mesorhizobium sp. B263B2A]
MKRKVSIAFGITLIAFCGLVGTLAILQSNFILAGINAALIVVNLCTLWTLARHT